MQFGSSVLHQINDLISSLEKKFKPTNLTEFDVIEKFDSLNSLKTPITKYRLLTIKRL